MVTDFLKKVAFETLFKNFTSSIMKKKFYKGYRLLAVDGSDLHTPTNKKETDSFYSGNGIGTETLPYEYTDKSGFVNKYFVNYYSLLLGVNKIL